MSTSYPGNADNVDPREAPSITIPADSDPANAASINAATETLADFVAFLQAYAGLLHTASTWDHAQTFNGGSGDAAVGALISAPAVTARKMLWDMSVGAAGQRTRLYLAVDGSLEITYNAWWNSANTRWQVDSLTFIGRINAVRFRFAAGQVYVDRPNKTTSSSTWTDSQWESQTSDGRVLAIVGTQSDNWGANPPAAVGVANGLCAKNICKAWAAVSCASDGTPTVADGFNIASVSFSSVGSVHTVTFATAMHDANYAVHLTASPYYGTTGVWAMISKSADHFDFTLENDAGGVYGAHQSEVNFVVFGRQDT
jgi:hypothetical protein